MSIVALRTTVAVLLLLIIGQSAPACIWDELARDVEKKRRPKLADLLYSNAPPVLSVEGLRKRLAVTEQENKQEEPLWHNNMAGTHLRLGEVDKALQIIQEALKRFPEDYGLHANLGAAYTLLGRYEDAEKAIEKALSLTEEPHYAERYHLAMLQYLNRPVEYQRRHLYLDEYTSAFLKSPPAYMSKAGLEMQSREYTEEDVAQLKLTYRSNTNKLLMELTAMQAAADPAPAYTQRWDLSKDPRWYDAVVYLATYYPKISAAYAMAGVAALQRKEFNPAITAFDRAILLGSPQIDILKVKNTELKQLAERSFRLREVQSHTGSHVATGCLVVLVGAALLSLFKQTRKKSSDTVEP